MNKQHVRNGRKGKEARVANVSFRTRFRAHVARQIWTGSGWVVNSETTPVDFAEHQDGTS